MKPATDQVATDKATQLLPCPFCGNADNQSLVVTETVYDKPRFYSVVCYGCCSIASGETRSKVVERWNTRHQSQHVEALKSQLSDLEGYYLAATVNVTGVQLAFAMAKMNAADHVISVIRTALSAMEIKQ